MTTQTSATAAAAGQIPKESSQKAFGYVRVSGISQSDGDGPVRQTEAIRMFVERENIELEAIYSELGVSGTVANADRPEWARMIADARAQGVQCIIIECLNRLARDLMCQEAAIVELRKAGIVLLSTMEPDLMANDPSRTLIRQLFGSLAEYDRAQTVAKLAAARRRKREAGLRCDGRKPYGHRPGEAAVIERMRQLRNEGWTFERIAQRLNSDGVPARAGRWHGRSVNRTLSQMQDRPGAIKLASLETGAPNM